MNYYMSGYGSIYFISEYLKIQFGVYKVFFRLVFTIFFTENVTLLVLVLAWHVYLSLFQDRVCLYGFYIYPSLIGC